MSGKRKPNLEFLRRTDNWLAGRRETDAQGNPFTRVAAIQTYKYDPTHNPHWQVISDALGKPAEPTVPEIEAAINDYYRLVTQGEASLTLTETKKAMQDVAKTAGKLMSQLDDMGATGAGWLGGSVDLE